MTSIQSTTDGLNEVSALSEIHVHVTILKKKCVAASVIATLYEIGYV